MSTPIAGFSAKKGPQALSDEYYLRDTKMWDSLAAYSQTVIIGA